MDNRYSIGEVAKTCCVPIKTLRYYDEIGLLKPEHRSTESNYRYYSKEQMTTLLIIRELRALKFSLKEIKDMISNADLKNLEIQMALKKANIDLEINRLHAKYEAVDALLNRIRIGAGILSSQSHQMKDGESQKEDVQIKQIPRGRMLYSRQIMKQYCNADVSLPRWMDIIEQCISLGIPIKSPIIVTYYCNVLDEFLMKDCDVEFGALIENETVIPDVPNIRDWGGMQALISYHVGKYSEIMRNHVMMLQWINKNHYELDGPVSEKFIISPLDVNNEEAHITQIIMPIKATET
jgi:DNA-binding transcriptional MerR regulator